MLKPNYLSLMKKYSDNEEYNLACWNVLSSQYSGKSRHYHNLSHIENMLQMLDEVKAEVTNIDTLLFAIYYHDIVYKATRNDNEYQSALLFEKHIAKTSFGKISACKMQIELTKEHLLSEDEDTNILMDLDLSILGSRSEEYYKYQKNIRKEYSIYPDFMYKKGRVKVVKSMLASGPIFKTSYFKDKLEVQARVNLENELKNLRV